MGRVAAVGKGTFNPSQNDFAQGRQSFGFIARKIHHQINPCAIKRSSSQQAQIPCLDHSTKVFWRPGVKHAVACLKQGLVIRHQQGAQGHEPERERGFPRARWPDQKNAPTIEGDTARMKAFGRQPRQTGSPTTNRAPSGSEVGSAFVGRMFSAQMTPPWASTICLEIDRPRPELLPKCVAGRSE